MRTFAVIGPNGQTSAWLYFDPVTETATLKINREAAVSHLSPSLQPFAIHGVFDLSQEDTDSWIRERVCPPGRENIQSILDRYGVDHYNPYLLSIALGGRAFCDKDHYEEIR